MTNNNLFSYIKIDDAETQTSVLQKKYGLQIKYEIRNDNYGGLGIFACKPIIKGTLIWCGKENVNIKTYNEHTLTSYLNTLKFEECNKFIHEIYCKNGKIYHIIDDGMKMNHSNNPNCYTEESTEVYATRNIDINEQLFEDYRTYDHPPYLMKIYEKYNYDNLINSYYEMPKN